MSDYLGRADSRDAKDAQPIEFEEDASRILQHLRTSLANVVANVPGHIAKPAELQRSLKIDINLSCKIFKVVNSPGSLSAASHVPGLSGLRTFLKAASRAGVRDQIIGAASEAAGEFNRLVARHAGDRPAFDTMVSPYADSSDASQVGLQQRRALYRGHRHILGVHAKTQISCFVLQPSDDQQRLDVARIVGTVDLCRLQRNASLIISLARYIDDEGDVRQVLREPLEPASSPDQEHCLLPEFCSRPLPGYRHVLRYPGTTCGELICDGVGKQAAVTCIEGTLNRKAVPRYRLKPDAIASYSAPIRVPCEALLLDVLVREGTMAPSEPKAYTCLEYQGETQNPSKCPEWLRLKPYEQVRYLGKGPSVLYSPDYPRYPELGHYVFDRLGWNGDDFSVYRCRVEYPILPSMVALTFDLLEEAAT